ncbi:hypothetical protein ACX8XP_12290 [Calditrichota bacterium LG25]
MKTFFSTLVFVLLAIPFVYMAYDVARDILKQMKEIVARKGRPILQGILQMFYQ